MDGIASPNAIVWPTLAESNSNSNNDDDERALPDDWPTAQDGSEWDGTRLLDLTRRGESPFGAAWNVEAFIGEVEQILNASVVDIPTVSRGANHYGLHVQLDSRPDVVARLSRHDVNSPGFHGSDLEAKQRQLSRFEIATYDALQPLARASQPHGRVFGGRPLHHRDPVAWRAGAGVAPPSPPFPHDASASMPPLCRTVLGRRLFLFEKSPGEGYDYVRWRALSPAKKSFLLAQSARVAATLFQYRLPAEYASTWLPVRITEHQQNYVSQREVTPTRDFCASLLHTRIEAALSRLALRLPHLAPRALLVRQDLDWLVPRVLPQAGNGLSETALYRFVLDHGDFGIHNMTIATDDHGRPYITSVYDWEAASIVPALLSEPKMVVTADLVVNDEGEPAISRWGDGDSISHMGEYLEWSNEYYKELFRQSPEYRGVIMASGDARRIWFAMREFEVEDHRQRLVWLSGWARRKVAEYRAKEGFYLVE
ncbi:3-hydroxybutyryl-CoA dehydratase [Hirsutella rhossiliensis]|uniref:3-hydroxybutyryl-CoA dehydratase n=1 Tax=Hirsutella rhossiliensis TaxID=111463 RepID=A0A9P8N1S3_9HYPO|nr:3-hydroxybutyryl-CoA dehydratase [Hirsutella rhossiliensis]KAH0966058.1 3-hydroxybutyryl-CoA dehydratase [Hirsutella rhossiliensis]